MNVADPIALFASIYQQAADAGIAEPNAMALATATPDGRPSVRIVLLKGFDDQGFVFYTNLESRKGRQLRDNPHAALCLYWQPIGRQVRIEGSVTPVSDAEADAYFATRARGSQIGAWASSQSAPLADRDLLLARVDEVEARYTDAAIPRPPHWSGFRLAPERIEFWSAGESRLHERLLFEREAGGGWSTSGLFP